MAIQFYTYLHCKPDGTPFYVGKGSGRRATFFFDRNEYHTRIVAKYGKENIKVYKFDCESEEQAFSDEKRQIECLRLNGFVLANFSDGGKGGTTGFKPSEETRKKLSLARIGKPSANKGKKHTQQAKNNMSSSQKGRKKSDEHKAKIAEAHKGKLQASHSDETRKKMSETQKIVQGDPDNRKKQSERMKVWWEQRKLKGAQNAI